MTGNSVRIHLDDSSTTPHTIRIYRELRERGHNNVGIVLQAYLRRSAGDAARMNQLGARVRLVKGAYQEPATVAYQRKPDVDAAFVEIMRELLERGTYPAFASHDPDMIAATKTFASSRGIPSDRYEFQMLYGIRRDLQAQLRDAGYRVRVYVPFGREWFPYFMRRLGERPANVGFVIRGVLHDRRG
jgi:proline dehydrogenase